MITNNFVESVLSWLVNNILHILLSLLLGFLAITSSRAEAAETRLAIYSCEDQALQSDYAALACNIYHEARGSTKADKMGIAFTTMNRANSERFKNTVAEVVYQNAAFSWTKDGKSDNVYNLDAWIECLSLSGWVLGLNPQQYALLDVTEGALFYHKFNINPYWASTKYRIGRIGAHYYYTDDKKI